MFAKSARFNNQIEETPGPGNYDPKAQRRASGIVSFAADSIQRFAHEREQDSKLGPGYYTTPSKADAVRRRTLVPSTFTDARKKLETLNGGGNNDSNRKLFDDMINELTASLRESEKALKAENARSAEAQARVELLQALCDQEVAKRHELEQQLEQLTRESAEACVKYEQELRQRNKQIESIEQQIRDLEEFKLHAQENIATLYSRIAQFEEARESLTAQFAALQTELETTKQEAQAHATELHAANKGLSEELQTTQQTVCNLEAKMTSTQLLLSTSQATFQEAQQQLQEVNQSYAALENTLASKEAQWNKLLEKLTRQIKKKNDTILNQRTQVDKLNEEQEKLQHQKLAADKQHSAQMQQFQDELQAHDVQHAAQITEARTNFDTMQTALTGRISSLTGDLAAEEAKVGALQSELQARSEELLSMREAKQQLAQQAEAQSRELASWQSRMEATQQMLEAESQARSKAEETLELEKNSRAEETKNSVLELQATLHQEQEKREELFAKLGNAEMHSQDMLVRAQAAEELAAKRVALLTEYESKLTSEIARCEHLVVQLANAEMELERNKGELADSAQLIAELRERFLTEQTLASEFESKFNMECSTVADLRENLAQYEQRAMNQKAENLSLTIQVEGHQATLSQLQQEYDQSQISHRHQVGALTEELRVQTEKTTQLAQALDEQTYQCTTAKRQLEEQMAAAAKLGASMEQMRNDLTAHYESQLQQKEAALQAMRDEFAASLATTAALTEKLEELERVQLIERRANERAVNAAMANLELESRALNAKTILCEQRGAQIMELEQARAIAEQARAAAEQDLAALQQETKRATEDKLEAVKSYSALLDSFHNATATIEEKEAALEAAFAEKQGWEKHKEAVQRAEQENVELKGQIEQLSKLAEESSEAIAAAAAWEARVSELEAANKDLQESLAVLDEEARETSNQNTLLVGHNNQKQRINILAKSAAENRKLKLENIRLANALHDLKKATAGSTVIDLENVAPTPAKTVEILTKATPASRVKSVRKQIDMDEDENAVAAGPLQQSFKAWQQKKQRLESARRTPLARLV